MSEKKVIICFDQDGEFCCMNMAEQSEEEIRFIEIMNKEEEELSEEEVTKIAKANAQTCSCGINFEYCILWDFYTGCFWCPYFHGDETEL